MRSIVAYSMCPIYFDEMGKRLATFHIPVIRLWTFSSGDRTAQTV